MCYLNKLKFVSVIYTTTKMEGEGDHQTISPELLQNLQSAVGSSGVIGQVQVIETENGPMTVIIMEEGAETAGETTLDVNGENLTQTTVDGEEQMQYEFVQDGENYTAQVFDTGQQSIAETVVTSSEAMDTCGVTMAVGETMQQGTSDTDTYYITDTGEIVKIEGSMVSEGQLSQQTVMQAIDTTSEMPQEQTIYQTVEDTVAQNMVTNPIVEQTVVTSIDAFGQTVIPSTDTSNTLTLEQALTQPDISQLTQDQAVIETISALNQLQQKQPPVVQTVTAPEVHVQVVNPETNAPTTVMSNTTIPEYTAFRLQDQQQAPSRSFPQSTNQRSLLSNKVEKKSVSSQVTYAPKIGGGIRISQPSKSSSQGKPEFGTFRVKKIGNQTVLEPVFPTSATNKQAQTYTKPVQTKKVNQIPQVITKPQPALLGLKNLLKSSGDITMPKHIAPRPAGMATGTSTDRQSYTYSYMGNRVTTSQVVPKQSTIRTTIPSTSLGKGGVGIHQVSQGTQSDIKSPTPAAATIFTKQFFSKVPGKTASVSTQILNKPPQAQSAKSTTAADLSDNEAADLLSSAMQEADMQLEEAQQGDIRAQQAIKEEQALAEVLTELLPESVAMQTDQPPMPASMGTITSTVVQKTEPSKIPEMKVI